MSNEPFIHRRRRASCLASIVLLLALQPAEARVEWYQVELIIFDEPNSAAKTEETWRDNPGLPELQNAIELAGADGLLQPDDSATPLAYRLINDASLQLRNAWSRLSRSGQYRPLVHLSWHQPGLGPQDARPAHIRAWGEPLGLEGTGTSSQLVDGTVRVYRTRFLHAEVDLLYNPDGVPGLGNLAPSVIVAPPSIAYRLTTSRKMRSKELHYIDHPLFGLLINVTPLAAE